MTAHLFATHTKLQRIRPSHCLLSLEENKYVKVEGPWPRLFNLEKYGAIGKITSQELMTGPDCAPESAKSVSTSRTCSHAHDGVVTLRGNPSPISSLVLLLGLISRFPTNELRVATNAQKRLRIDYDSVTMSKNALGIWYESRTIFRIGEFVAKVLNSSKLLSRIPDRPTNCKN